MGNFASCTLTAPMMRITRAARVVLPSGEVRQFRQPTKAAELMLDCPNFFLADARSLQLGRRFSAIGADDDLEFGSVYIMFPMRRVASVVTAADMAMLFVAVNSTTKRIGIAGPQTKELDYGKTVEGPPRLSSEGLTELKYSFSVCRSRKPQLETIKEEALVC